MSFSGAGSSARRPPIAGGQPIGEAVADQAAEWLTLLMSGEASDKDRQRWRRWRAAHPDHERAWRHIEAVTGRFELLQRGAAYQALSPYARATGPKSAGRRKAARLLLWGSLAGAAGLLASRTQSWRQMTADLRTGIGERRTELLTDGTRVMLNTASAIDVRFDARYRLLRLVAGEVLIATGHAAGAAADPRPFVVETAEGRIRALGTRFAVRQCSGHTSVVVLENAVEIMPADGGQTRVLRAGERTSFTRTTLEATASASEQAAAWTHGQIVASDMRLEDFLAELSRYRPGIVRCEPAAAGLRFSGVFPLDDTDRILAALPQVLPVRVRRRTRYWVTVETAR